MPRLHSLPSPRLLVTIPSSSQFPNHVCSVSESCSPSFPNHSFRISAHASFRITLFQFPNPRVTLEDSSPWMNTGNLWFHCACNFKNLTVWSTHWGSQSSKHIFPFHQRIVVVAMANAMAVALWHSHDMSWSDRPQDPMSKGKYQWTHSFVKLRSAELFQYQRIIYFDVDAFPLPGKTVGHISRPLYPTMGKDILWYGFILVYIGLDWVYIDFLSWTWWYWMDFCFFRGAASTFSWCYVWALSYCVKVPWVCYFGDLKLEIYALRLCIVRFYEPFHIVDRPTSEAAAWTLRRAMISVLGTLDFPVSDHASSARPNHKTRISSIDFTSAPVAQVVFNG